MEKLVRDKIPALIREKGGEPNIRVLDEKEYRVRLEEKLQEEVGEYLQDKNAEELADILEVVLALADSIGCTREMLQETYRKKHNERGGFKKRILLISNEAHPF